MQIVTITVIGVFAIIVLVVVGNTLFGETTNPAKPSLDKTPKVVEITNCPRSFSWSAVGEAHYQKELDEICGGRREDGHDLEVDVILMPEDDNRHDPLAYCVRINGYRVGYLSRGDARMLRETVKGTVSEGAWIKVPGRIRGGWNRGPEDNGAYGVVIDLPVAMA